MLLLRTLQALPRAATIDAVQAAHPRPALGACGYARFAAKVALPRDPERPKLPLSSYLRFAADFREREKLKGGPVAMRTIGAAWKGLPPEEKKPFEEAAKSEREVYQEAFNKYKDSGKHDAWTRDPKQPKRPSTPWIRFATAERKSPRFASMKMTEATKLLKADWDNLPTSQKDDLAKEFKADMEKYKQAMAEYKASGAETTWLERTGRLEIMRKEEEKKAKLKEKELEKKRKAKEAKEKLKAKSAALKAKLKEKEAKEKLKMAAAKKKEAARLAKDKLKAKAAERKEKLKK